MINDRDMIIDRSAINMNRILIFVSQDWKQGMQTNIAIPP